jgi:hypothetical protein
MRYFIILVRYACGMIYLLDHLRREHLLHYLQDVWALRSMISFEDNLYLSMGFLWSWSLYRIHKTFLPIVQNSQLKSKLVAF